MEFIRNALIGRNNDCSAKYWNDLLKYNKELCKCTENNSGKGKSIEKCQTIVNKLVETEREYEKCLISRKSRNLPSFTTSSTLYGHSVL